jgi:hypothetical protein
MKNKKSWEKLFLGSFFRARSGHRFLIDDKSKITDGSEGLV